MLFLLGLFLDEALNDAAADCSEAQPIQVLFLGNSYTSSNSLPSLVSQFACGMGENIVYDSYTPGGYWFLNHKDDPVTLSKINSTNWDFVVLQNQSQVPGWKPSHVTANSLPNAQELVSLILNNRKLHCTSVSLQFFKEAFHQIIFS